MSLARYVGSFDQSEGIDEALLLMRATARATWQGKGRPRQRSPPATHNEGAELNSVVASIISALVADQVPDRKPATINDDQRSSR